MLAVITGASRGIGESYARQLAARGYGLHVVGRDADRLATLAAGLRAAHPVPIEEIVLDFALPDLLSVSYMSLYEAYKTFIASLVLRIEQEVRPYGVFVQTCCPGQTLTDFHQTARMSRPYASGGQQSPDSVVAESLAAVDRR